MGEALLEPRGQADSRLLLTIVIAAAVHAMVVLGVRFTPDAPLKSRFAAMEVMLVPAPAPAVTSGYPLQLDTTAPTDAGDEPPLLAIPPVEPPVIKAAPTPSPAPVNRAPVRRAPVKASMPPVTAPSASAATSEATAAAAPPLPTAAQLIERSLAIAATGAGLLEEKTVSGQSKSERTLYIKNNTRDWTEIAYSDAVRRKVKQHGELLQHNVPSGRVGVDVAVASDGSLVSVTITKSSAIKETDAEAIRVVENAAPYAPLPAKMAGEADVAHLEFIVNITQDEGFSSGQ